MVRRLHDGPQLCLPTSHTVILTSHADLDLHHPPCRNFRANQAFYACGQLAQLLLRAMQYELLPVADRTHGLRTLIRHLIRTMARLVRSGRCWRLDFATTNFRLDWLLYAA